MSSAHSPTFRHFTYVTAHSPTLPLLHLRHSSFSKPSVASPTSQVILQHFRCFIYVTAHSPIFRHFTYITNHSPTLPSLYLRHSTFSDPSAASPTSQFILQPFFGFSYVTSSSLNSPGEAAELILQPFRHFTYVTAHSPTLLSLLLRHKLFT